MSSKWVSSTPLPVGGVRVEGDVGVVASKRYLKNIYILIVLTSCWFFLLLFIFYGKFFKNQVCCGDESYSSFREASFSLYLFVFLLGGGLFGGVAFQKESKHNGKHYRHVDQASGSTSHRSRFEVTIWFVRKLSGEERMASRRRFHLCAVSPL